MDFSNEDIRVTRQVEIVPGQSGGAVPPGMRCHRVATLREALRPLG